MSDQPRKRYIVDIKAAQSPSKYWGWAKVVRVLDTSVGPTDWYWVRRGTVAQWGDQKTGRGTWHLDGKYSGPRSAFGRALREARDLADKLNREVEEVC